MTGWDHDPSLLKEARSSTLEVDRSGGEGESTITRRLSGSRLLLWVGAGISRDSGLPLASELRDTLISEVLGRPAPRMWKRLPLEALLSCFDDVGVRSFERAFVSSMPSFAHRVVARFLLTQPNQVVVTTNFDTLIEEAFRLEVVALENSASDRRLAVISDAARFMVLSDPDIVRGPTLIKLHGSVDDPPTLHDTIKRLTDASRHLLMRPALDYVFNTGPHDTVLVLGYGGHDEYDINPVLKYLGMPKKPVVFVQHRTAFERPSDDLEPGAGEFDDNVFFDSLAERHEADTGGLLRTLCSAKGWFDLLRESDSRDAPLDWRRELVSIRSALSEGWGWKRALLAGTITHAMLNMFDPEQVEHELGHQATTEFVRETVRAFERGIAFSTAADARGAELYGQFMLASIFSRWWDEGSPRWVRAGGHALCARDLAVQLYGERSAAYLKCAMLCAIVEEARLHDGRRLLPEYQRLSRLADECGFHEEAAFASLLVARAQCAVGDYSSGRLTLEAALPDIERYGRRQVLAGTYLVLARVAQIGGDYSAHESYSREYSDLCTLDGSPHGKAILHEMMEGQAGGESPTEFDLVLLPDAPRIEVT